MLPGRGNEHNGRRLSRDLPTYPSLSLPCARTFRSHCPRHLRHKRQRIGNQIDAAMIFARADFVNRGCIAWLDVLTGSALT